ncbi:WD40-repeat-containing domain protein [Panaeolus papilionaceus]|nr:WD40-repeat-containing domain protein [Panaeolus papilionaceus]
MLEDKQTQAYSSSSNLGETEETTLTVHHRTRGVLDAHSSCVNALAFSSGDGRFLASGGDDYRILLWDFYQDDVQKPFCTMRGPKGNIFCLEFSATNRFLISGGTTDTILKYDISYLGSAMAAPSLIQTPDRVYRVHSDSIRAISCHPTQDDDFLTASDDGTIIRHDARVAPGGACNRMASIDVLATPAEATGVQYHPTIEHYFLTSDSSGGVFLRDTRMAFGAGRPNDGIVMKYNTKLTRKVSSRLCNPEASSVSFNQEGTSLAVLYLHYLPTIYSLSDADPIATLSGKHLPDGSLVPPTQRTFSNSCTMKHGSFGGARLGLGDLYAAGSDDFQAYVWKIPPTEELMDKRDSLSVAEWENYGNASTIAFTQGRLAPKVVPAEISTPFCHLKGHNSLVNTTLFHPHFLHVLTSGVERKIFLHSPTPSSPCTHNLDRAPTEVRKLKDSDDEDRIVYYNAISGIRPLDVESGDDASEMQTLRLFDQILRSEGETDVFGQRPWRSPDSTDSEGDDNASDDSDADNLMVMLT